MKELIDTAAAVVVGITILVAIALLTALPVFLSWNAVVPQLFSLPSITFGQALWLSILASCLFKPSVPGKSDIKKAIIEARKL